METHAEGGGVMEEDKWFREQVNSSRVELGIRYEPAVYPGLDLAICIGPSCRAPLGQVWYEWAARGEIEIVYSYVDPRARRMGVRTRIHEALSAAYPGTPMITAGNSGSEARAWQLKSGWRRIETDSSFEMSDDGPWKWRPNTETHWQPVTPKRPPEFHAVYLYRTGDLHPAVGFRMENDGETKWLRADAGAEDGEHQEYGLIGGPGWNPTHYREIEGEIPGRREAQAKVATRVERIIRKALRKAEGGAE